MVTRQQLWDQLGHRPFQPFRLMLTEGGTIDVIRANQAVVTPRELIVGTEDRTRWIQLEKIDRMDVFELRQTTP